MANDTIIPKSELAAIAAEFGPKTGEDVAYIVRRSAGVNQGAGRTKAQTILVGPLGCRLVYVGNMTVRERMEAGQLVSSGDYIISLPAGTVVVTGDIIRVSALHWDAEKTYVAGEKCIPTDGSNLLMVCTVGGRTGFAEPPWPNTEKTVLEDGSVVWTTTGQAPEFQVIQLAGPQTYGDFFSIKLAATLRQKVL